MLLCLHTPSQNDKKLTPAVLERSCPRTYLPSRAGATHALRVLSSKIRQKSKHCTVHRADLGVQLSTNKRLTDEHPVIPVLLRTAALLRIG